jgi:hypothetical protein
MSYSGDCGVLRRPPGIDYVAVSAGGEYWYPEDRQTAAALRSDGSIVAWGFEEYEQWDVPVLPPGLTYTQVSVGAESTFALRSDGSIVGWGNCEFGVCDVPPLPPGTSYVEISAGRSHCLALRDDGVVVAWGANWDGQCDVPPAPPGMTYVHVVASDRFSLALRSDGTVAGWGSNPYGRYDVPDPPAGTAYTQLSAGDLHTVALRSDGAVIAVGYDGHGLLDVPPPPPCSVYVEISANCVYTLARWEQLPPVAPAPYCTAKANSLGCVPSIGWIGSPSLSGPDDFVVTASNVRSQRTGMAFWGLAPAAIPFRGGTLCVAPPLVRRLPLTSGGSAGGFDCSGIYREPFANGYFADRSIGAGEAIHVQFWSRDGDPPFAIGLTDALRVVVNP